MPDFRINDDWILNRFSSQSTSFSQDNRISVAKDKKKEDNIAQDVISI